MKMTVPPTLPVALRYSADSDSDGASGSGGASAPEDNVYRRKYQLLLERCEVLQQDNERIVNRIYEAKKITKRHKKDVRLLMERLDTYGDGYRTATADADSAPAARSKSAVKSQQSRSKNQDKASSSKSHDKSTASKKQDKPSSGKNQDKQSGDKKPAKRKSTKGEKAEKDPNAPKKPCNAFFQYCQEQRPFVVAETGGDTGIPEMSKQEVTKQLASRWRALSVEDKQVYVQMFERSKEKYAEEMSAYYRQTVTDVVGGSEYAAF